MNYSVKLPDGSEVVLLYTKNFEWKDKSKGEDVGSAPYTGRVYRALKTAGDNNYYVNLEVPHVPGKLKVEGIRITSLNYTTPEWVCSFAEVTEDNIIDFDIVAEDYRKINTWLETEQQDFIDRLFKTGLDVEASSTDSMEVESQAIKITDYDAIVKAITGSIVPSDSRAIEAIQWISMRDPMGLEAITHLLTMYADFIKVEDTAPVLPLQREVATSEQYGRGANIAYIAKALDEHSRDKSDSKERIFSLFLPLVFELQRQFINPTK
jgi:hypothetical protein